MQLLDKNTFQGVEVITSDLIAKEHGMAKSGLHVLFNRNAKWFVPSEDVFVIEKESLKPWEDGSECDLDLMSLFTNNKQKKAYLFTLSGYKKLFHLFEKREKNINASKIIFKDYFNTYDYLPIAMMRIEHKVLDFIEGALPDCLTMFRQVYVNPYHVDAYIPKLNLVIEVDEYGHKLYDKEQEQIRENYIKEHGVIDIDFSDGVEFIRFDPYSDDFKLEAIIKQILDMFIARVRDSDSVIPLVSNQKSDYSL